MLRHCDLQQALSLSSSLYTQLLAGVKSKVWWVYYGKAELTILRTLAMDCVLRASPALANRNPPLIVRVSPCGERLLCFVGEVAEAANAKC
jgi:hypothetical protein